MKRLLYLLSFSGLLVAGCSNGASEVKQYIPGRYVSNYAHEYASGRDTITIEPFGDEGYTITRHIAFQRIRDGKKKPMEHSLRKYSGVYQPQTRTVFETRGGVTLYFDPSAGQMKWGTAVYTKIDN